MATRVRSIFLALLFGALSITNSSFASSLEKPPIGEAAGDQNISPFYRWSVHLPSKPGQMLRSEALPPALIPRQASSAWRILYTSTDARWHGGVIPASGTLYLPRGQRPRAGWRLVIWAHGTLGVADSCAPSWTGANPRDRNYISRWLDEGFAVMAPDYQGLGTVGPHPYLNWESEGRSVLDAARAALRSGHGIENKLIITGQSQGSDAALGAARQAASYAPELGVRGTIATAVVTTFPVENEPISRKSPALAPYFVIYRMMTGGLPNGSPSIESLLSKKGRILLDAARTRCDSRAVAEANGITRDNAFAIPVDSIEAMLGPVGAMNPFHTRFPLMIGIGLSDELIPPERQRLALRTICRAGNSVRFHGYEGARHGETLSRSADDAVAFARAVMDGNPISSECSQTPG